MNALAGDDTRARGTWAGMRESASASGARRIVYVDDDAIYAYLLKVSLARLGHKVQTFVNPREALAAVEAPGAAFDAFITDFNLPEISGVDLALEARRRCPGLPNGVITNRIEDAGALAREVGVLALPKPCAPQEFSDMLARVLAQT